MLEQRVLDAWLQDGDKDALARVLRDATRRGDPILMRNKGLREYFDAYLGSDFPEEPEWYVPLVRYAAATGDDFIAGRAFTLLRSDTTKFAWGDVHFEGMYWPFQYPKVKGVSINCLVRMTWPVEMELIWTGRRIRDFLDPYLEQLTEWFPGFCSGTDLITDCYLQLLEASTSDSPKKYLKKAEKLAEKALMVVRNRLKKRNTAYLNGEDASPFEGSRQLSYAGHIAECFWRASREDIAAEMATIMTAYQRCAAYRGDAVYPLSLGRRFLAHLMGFDHNALEYAP